MVILVIFIYISIISTILYFLYKEFKIKSGLNKLVLEIYNYYLQAQEDEKIILDKICRDKVIVKKMFIFEDFIVGYDFDRSINNLIMEKLYLKGIKHIGVKHITKSNDEKTYLEIIFYL